VARPRRHRDRPAHGRARRDRGERRAAARQDALHISVGDRQWIVTAYTLTFGSLLLLGGRIADYVGRKRTFLIGLVGFALASALGGAAINAPMLSRRGRCRARSAPSSRRPRCRCSP